MRWVSRLSPPWFHPPSLRVVYPSTRSEWSGLLGGVGLGVWTNRRKSVDFELAVRWRTVTQGMEGSSSSRSS